MSGNSADSEALPFSRFLDGAADLDAVAGRQACRGSPSSFGQIALVTSGACTPSTTSARTVIDQVAVAPPQDRLLVRVVEARDLRQRHGDAVARRRW